MYHRLGRILLHHHPIKQRLVQPKHSTRHMSFFPRINSLRHIPLLVGGSLASIYSFVHYKVVGTAHLWSPHHELIPVSPVWWWLSIDGDHGPYLLYCYLVAFISTTVWVDQQIDSVKSSVSDILDTLSGTISPLQDSVQSSINAIQASLSSATISFNDLFSSPNTSRGEHHSSDSTNGLGPNSDPTQPHTLPDDKDSSSRDSNEHRGLVDLTKQLIEVRNILKTVKISNNLVLPSIVVIGSQSSGKSSVLEAIVGQEFLPKGNNMVTRRPLELTLIHSPDLETEYAEFPDLGLPKMTNFKQVQQTLTDLNSAVPASQCVSNNPIELHVYSAKVPDLTLIDLPGYIQIHAKNQPVDLKEKISVLCDQYLTEPNIILAVCAADVDLANSEALRASRRVDPMGIRTIGVLTKLDLVTPEIGVQLLTNNEYPLQLGYVGVVNKTLLHHNSSSSLAITRLNNKACVGVNKLRSLLMQTLELRMSERLAGIMDAVDQERSETQYQFKVLYNDRRVSAEGYFAETMDAIKHLFKQSVHEFSKPEIRSEVRDMLEQRILEICQAQYWSRRDIDQMGKIDAANEPSSTNELNVASSILTKSGIGRESTQLVVKTIMHAVESLVASPLLVHHPELKQKLVTLATQLLRAKYQLAVDQVENIIKPFKYDLVDVSDQEWKSATKRICELVTLEITKSQKLVDQVKAKLGRRTMNRMIQYLKTKEPELYKTTESLAPHLLNDSNRPPGYTDTALTQAHLALFHTHRIEALWSRMYALKSAKCSTPAVCNACPETYLVSVAHQLAHLSTMFIYVELVLAFVNEFPRLLDNLYPPYTVTQSSAVSPAMVFAKQNPSVSKLLDLAERQRVLDLAYSKLRVLVQMQQNQHHHNVADLFGTYRR